jgi:thiol-disulfide isomerase/thioredoxin
MKPFHVRSIVALSFGLLLIPFQVAHAALYRAGDTVQNFSLVNRATGNPVQLTDFGGKIVVLDWFAWWCPFCQAAAPQLYTGIDEWYATRGGNPGGIPVVHVGVNLQPGQESQTQNFVTRAKLDLVLQDFNRAVAGRIAANGQPIFAIINGVTNSPSHKPWELLYSRLGYGETSFPVAEFRTAIDAVQAARVAPAPATLSLPQIDSNGRFTIQVAGEAGRSYRLESTSDLVEWTTEETFTLTGTTSVLRTGSAASGTGRLFRVVTP